MVWPRRVWHIRQVPRAAVLMKVQAEQLQEPGGSRSITLRTITDSSRRAEPPSSDIMRAMPDEDDEEEEDEEDKEDEADEEDEEDEEEEDDEKADDSAAAGASASEAAVVAAAAARCVSSLRCSLFRARVRAR